MSDNNFVRSYLPLVDGFFCKVKSQIRRLPVGQEK
jgi:hypothetical protein